MRNLIVLFLFAVSITVSAQQDKVLEIRKIYQEVKTWVNASDPDSVMYSGFHCDKVLRNTNNSQWRAVGNFSDTITFWYRDLMEAAMSEGNTAEDSSWALALVTQNQNISVTSSYREWLFLDGQLIFAYEKMNGYDTETSWEYRYYFNKGKLIRFMSGSQIISLDEDPADVRASAEEMKKLFVLIVK